MNIIFIFIFLIKNNYYDFILNIFLNKVPEENKGVMTYENARRDMMYLYHLFTSAA
jgi:hypothetical protein